jgi:CRP-like cAMP-binding protein
MAADEEDIFARAIRKLGRLTQLDEADRHAIRSLDVRIQSVPANELLVSEGVRAEHCCLLLDGYACRHKETSGGGRQILAFQLTGDLLDVHRLFLPHVDHNVETITPATIGRIPVASLRALMLERPRVAEALWRDTLIDAAIAREWVLNVGRRTATARIAHMLCELAARREAAGFGSPERFELPMTQEQIGDATGLTSVHVNRKLHDLDDVGVIARTRRELHIVDWPRLKRIGEFDPSYLYAAA